jgi:hypothetical protein
MSNDKKTWVERVGKERKAVNDKNEIIKEKSLSSIQPAANKTWAEKVGKKPAVTKAQEKTPPTKGRSK